MLTTITNVIYYLLAYARGFVRSNLVYDNHCCFPREQYFYRNETYSISVSVYVASWMVNNQKAIKSQLSKCSFCEPLLTSHRSVLLGHLATSSWAGFDGVVHPQIPIECIFLPTSCYASDLYDPPNPIWSWQPFYLRQLFRF